MRSTNLLSAAILFTLVLIDLSLARREPLRNTPLKASDSNDVLATRIYDIRQLIADESNSTAVDFDLQLPSTSSQRQTSWRDWLDSIRNRLSSEGNPGREERVETITKTIQESVDPDSWRDAGGSAGTLRELQGQLIVIQTPTAHREIEKVLEGLRGPDIRFFSRRTAPLFLAGFLLLGGLNFAAFRRRRRLESVTP